MPEKQLAKEESSQLKPEISLTYIPFSNHFMGPKNYADYYSGVSRGFRGGIDSSGTLKKQIEAVARELNLNPGASFEFDLSAGNSEKSRNFGAMMYGLQGYSAALAEAAYHEGFNLRVIVDLDGKKYEYGRMGILPQIPERKYQVYDRLPDDPEKPTKYLLIQEKQHPTALTRIYTGDGALVGYKMEARLVETNPMEKRG